MNDLVIDMSDASTITLGDPTITLASGTNLSIGDLHEDIADLAAFIRSLRDLKIKEKLEDFEKRLGILEYRPGGPEAEKAWQEEVIEGIGILDPVVNVDDRVSNLENRLSILENASKKREYFERS